MQIKTPMDNYSIAIRVATNKKIDRMDVCQECRRTELSFTAAGSVKWFNHFGKELV